jgi:predicted metal-dependent peptidase
MNTPTHDPDSFWEKMDQAKFQFLDMDGNEFFSFLLSNIEIICDPNAAYKTAWTNGPQMGFHPEFVEKCKVAELVGVTYHELQHVIYEHVTIAQEMSLDPKIHNIACDHYNNLEALSQGFVLPSFIDFYADSKYAGWSSMEIYDHLAANKEDREKDFAIFESGLGADIAPLPEGMDPKEAKDEIGDLLIQAVMQADMSGAPGSVPSDIRRWYDEVSAPKRPWWKILHTKVMTQFAKDDYSMRRPNRRHQHRGIYLPQLFSEKVGAIAYGFDVSGSMGSHDMGLAVSVSKDIRHALKPSEIHVMCFDTEVHDCGTLREGQPFSQVELIGGGGTDVNPFLDMCREKKPDIMICFTDGGFLHPSSMEGIDTTRLFWVLTCDPWCKSLRGTEIRVDTK